MDYKYIIYIVLAVAVILAVIFKDKIKASFMGLKLNAENTTRRNKADIKGDQNKVKQRSNSKSLPVNNSAGIKGSGNDVEQN